MLCTCDDTPPVASLFKCFTHIAEFTLQQLYLTSMEDSNKYVFSSYLIFKNQFVLIQIVPAPCVFPTNVIINMFTTTNGHGRAILKEAAGYS